MCEATSSMSKEGPTSREMLINGSLPLKETSSCRRESWAKSPHLTLGVGKPKGKLVSLFSWCPCQEAEYCSDSDAWSRGTGRFGALSLWCWEIRDGRWARSGLLGLGATNSYHTRNVPPFIFFGFLLRFLCSIYEYHFPPAFWLQNFNLCESLGWSAFGMGHTWAVRVMWFCPQGPQHRLWRARLHGRRSNSESTKLLLEKKAFLLLESPCRSKTSCN